MQYSLKTLMLAAGVLAMLSALTSKFGSVGLLGGIALILASIICYYFTKLPIRHGLANGILLGAISLHVALINYFFPVATEWAIEAMSAAAERGYTIQMDEYETQAESMVGFMIVCGYFPAFIVMLVRILLFHIWECTGLSRLALSLWLLILPFLSAWYTIHHYKSF